MAIRMTTQRNWNLLNIRESNGHRTPRVLEPGVYEMERIHNSKYDCNWLVLKGTDWGASEGSWRPWTNIKGSIDWGTFEVVIEENN